MLVDICEAVASRKLPYFTLPPTTMEPHGVSRGTALCLLGLCLLWCPALSQTPSPHACAEGGSSAASFLRLVEGLQTGQCCAQLRQEVEDLRQELLTLRDTLASRGEALHPQPRRVLLVCWVLLPSKMKLCKS